MIRFMMGGPFDGEEAPEGTDDVDEIQLYIHGEDEDDYSLVYVYIEDDETGNFQYEGEFTPKQLEEEDDE
jgi:hypothetical protein